MRYYFMQTDDLGIECVDELWSEEIWTIESVGLLADAHPEVIYFGIEVSS